VITTLNSFKIQSTSLNQGIPSMVAGIRLPRRRHLILITLLLPLFLSACNLLGVRGSGTVVSEAREVSEFNRVVFGGIGELLISQDGDESLIVTADDNLLQYVEAEVRGGTLFIKVKESWGKGLSPSQPIRFNLNVREIIGLDVAGQVDTKTGDLVTDRLAVNVSGLSSLTVGALRAQELVLHLSGSNEVELIDSGEVAEQAIVLIGPSEYRAPGLRSQKAEVTINGSGEATVWATGFLNITVSGKGSVDYYGSPQVTQHGSGLVNISSLGDP
jgi:hypothetical protein